MAPQISGTIGNGGGDNWGIFYKDSIKGCFRGTGNLEPWIIPSTGSDIDRYVWVNFAASTSSSLYGAGNTIRPINTSCKFYVKY